MKVRLLVTAAAVLVVAGCGTVDTPDAPAVPAVESPKGLVGIDPCALLDGAALAALGLDDGAPGQDELGANCRWSGRGEQSAQITAFTSGQGLTDLAREGDAATSRVRVLGYPALETFTAGGGFCRYDVGVAADQAVVATMTSGEPDSCTALQELLAAVLDGLPAAD